MNYRYRNIDIYLSQNTVCSLSGADFMIKRQRLNP